MRVLEHNLGCERKRLAGSVSIAAFPLLFMYLLAQMAGGTSTWAAVPNGETLAASPTVTASCTPGFDVVESPNAGPGYNYLSDLAVISANDIWAVGAYSVVSFEYRTMTMHWDGIQWSIVPSPNPSVFSNTLNDVVAVASNDVWAVGRTEATFGGADQALIIHWDGSSWSTVPSPNPEGFSSSLEGITAVSANDIWAVGHYVASSGRRTLVMRWNGSTWSITPSPNPPNSGDFYLEEVTALAPNDVWAVGYAVRPTGTPDETLTLRWNGSNWTRVSSPNQVGADSYLYSVAATSPNDVWAVGFYFNGSTRRTLVMRWNGSTWSIVPSPNPTGATSNRLYSVTAVSANDVWAVGVYSMTEGSSTTRGLVMRWDGVQWSIVPGPGGSERKHVLAAVATISPNNIWVVGRDFTRNNLTLTAQWNGSTWNVIPSPSSGTGLNSLAGVAAASPNDIWAVGNTNDTNTLIERWNGTQWSIVPSPNNELGYNRLTSVSVVSPNDVWAVGSYNTDQENSHRTLIMHWNGRQWSIVQSPNPGTHGNSLTGVTAISANDVWAVGHYSDGTSTSTLTIHWDGTTWTVIPSPNMGSTSSSLRAVSAVAWNDVWAVGGYAAGPQRTLTMHWNGTSWTIVPSPNPGGSEYEHALMAVSAVSANNVWAVGYYRSSTSLYHQMLILRWNGEQWSVVPGLQPPGWGAAFLLGVDALAPNDVWAVGYHHISPQPYDQRFVMHWDGSAWSLVPSANPPEAQYNRFQGVVALTSNDVWAVGSQGGYSRNRTLVERYHDPCTGSTPTRIATITPTNTPVPGCRIQFTDVDANNPFYSSVRCLACRGIVSGYADGTFRPNNEVTRGQLAKIVSNAASFQESPGSQIFQDVPSDHTFYEWINRLTNRGYMSGYNCGSAGEPCVNNRPYFRPFSNATRAQTSKIVSNAARYNDPPTGQTFEDVPPSHPFYEWIQRLASRGIMGGYECGGPGEPCMPGNKPYFRPYNNVTRGQSAKIVANTFYPGCSSL